MKLFFYLSVFLLLVSCKNQNNDRAEEKNNSPEKNSVPPVLSLSENIEEAHNKVGYMQHEAVSFDIHLTFNGNSRLKANVSMLTNSSRIKIQKDDGSMLVFDGKTVYQNPANKNSEGARFDIFTWSYFFALPFKLTDPGTVWEKKPDQNLEGKSYHTAKLTFQTETGDSPDDWYLIYQDKNSLRLKAAAYIVTFNTSAEEAEKSPHMIVYDDFEMIEQVAFPEKWNFHNWTAENGIGEKLGEATISNIRFLKPEKDFFAVPEKAKEVER